MKTLPAEFQVDWKILWKFRDRAKSAVLLSAPLIPTSTSALLSEAREVGYGAIHQLEGAAEEAVTSAPREITQAAVALLPTDKIQEGLRLKELISRQLIIALLNYAFISFLDQAQQTLLPLMYTAPIEQYGLGLSSDDMTKIMAKWGSYNTLIQLVLFPWLLKRYGPKKVYTRCLSTMLVFFASFPVLHLAAEYRQFVLRPLLAIHMGNSSFVYMAYGNSIVSFSYSKSDVILGCSQIFIMDAVPDKGSMGSVNGIGQSVGSSARMVAGPMISFLRAVSLKDKIFGGNLVYAVLSCITMIGSVISALLPRHA
jgi:MFS family permease